MPRVAVVGSMNMDIINVVDRHPALGETITCRRTLYSPGGKGANQAVAAARAGAEVVLLGAVGADGFADELVGGLRASGVDVSAVRPVKGTTGLAFITVDSLGQNSIMLSAGANAKLRAADVLSAALWDKTDAVLLQNEIPRAVTLAAMREAKRRGVRIFFNPAPAEAFTAEELSGTDCLIFNEQEAHAMTGVVPEDDASVSEVLRRTLAAGPAEVVLTLGEKGCAYASGRGEVIVLPAHPVPVVDTTAAGDAFIGTFATARAEGKDLREALDLAQAAAALTIMKRGAQASIPRRAAVEEFVSARSSSPKGRAARSSPGR